jgi:superfamily I DNA/RNA helicase
MTAAPEHIEEERRVFYVGITRAVERLCVTTEKKRRSRFLAEMDRPYRDRPKRSLWRWVGVIRAGS